MMTNATAREATREHDWKLMTMADVVVCGVDLETREPFGIVVDEVREGVNCGTCGVPWYPETEVTKCSGPSPD